MQNIIEICKEFGFEIPADKQGEFTKKVAENYVTRVEHEKKLRRLNTVKMKDILGDMAFRYDGKTGIVTVSGRNIQIANEPH